MAVMNLIGRLQTLCDTYCEHAGVPRTRVARVVFNDQRRLDAVFGGEASLTIPNFEKLVMWLSANWPEGLDWPTGVERPEVAAPNHSPDAANMVVEATP